MLHIPSLCGFLLLFARLPLVWGDEGERLVLHDIPSKPGINAADEPAFLETHTPELKRHAVDRLHVQYPNLQRTEIERRVESQGTVPRKLGTLIRYETQPWASYLREGHAYAGRGVTIEPVRQNEDELWRWLYMQKRMPTHELAVQAFGPRQSWDLDYARQVTRERLISLRGQESHDPMTPPVNLDGMVDQVLRSHLALGPFPTKQQFDSRRNQFNQAKAALAHLPRSSDDPEAVRARRHYEILSAGHSLDLDYSHELNNRQRDADYKDVISRRKLDGSDDDRLFTRNLYRATNVRGVTASDAIGEEVLEYLERIRALLEEAVEPLYLRSWLRMYLSPEVIMGFDLRRYRIVSAMLKEIKNVQIAQVEDEYKWVRAHRGWEWSDMERLFNSCDRSVQQETKNYSAPPSQNDRWINHLPDMPEHFSVSDRAWLLHHFQQMYSQDATDRKRAHEARLKRSSQQ